MASPSLLSVARYGREPATTPAYGRTYHWQSVSRRQSLESCASGRALDASRGGSSSRSNSFATSCLEAIAMEFLEPSSCISVPYPSPPQSPLSTALSVQSDNGGQCTYQFQTPPSGFYTSFPSRDSSRDASRRQRSGTGETAKRIRGPTASTGSQGTSTPGSASSERSGTLSLPSPKTLETTRPNAASDVTSIFQALLHEFLRHENDVASSRQMALQQATKLRHQNDEKERRVEALEILVKALRKARDREVAATGALDQQSNELLKALAQVKHLMKPLWTRASPVTA
ncbi:hypothetical protein TGRUB_305000 [Toxoplasma gondii RUB]|uniref:Uncharacterized protein n=1 Tax=Toxoplasma gondii RUB TaxID=935652 RepID=A0A086LRF0_TOXGO|nr:hypothetical protein TGRUB_305000 [Toxoplasma gondii RUB]